MNMITTYEVNHAFNMGNTQIIIKSELNILM